MKLNSNDTSFIFRTSNGYAIEFSMDVSDYRISTISNTMLNIEVKDISGMIQNSVKMPDYKAYQFLQVLEVMAGADECEIDIQGVKTIEIPPDDQFIRKSIILSTSENNPINFAILETNIFNSQQHSLKTYFIGKADPQTQELIDFLYLNFEMCAIKTGYNPEYYYTHLEEFFDGYDYY